MGLIDVASFKAIADRMASQYALLVALEEDISPEGIQAFGTTVFGDNNKNITFTAVDDGTQANGLIVTYNTTLSSSSPLTIVQTSSGITVTLATNGGGTTTTTASQLVTAFAAGYAQGQELMTAALASGSNGTGVLSAGFAILFGGTNGLYNNIITETNDSDVENDLTAEALNLDEQMTAARFASGITVLTGMITGLRSHMSNQAQAGLINGFCEDNDIRVHEYFDELYYLANSAHLTGNNVFKAVEQDIGVVTITNGDPSELVIRPMTGHAELTIDPTGTNNAIYFKHSTPGQTGNSWSLRYVNPGTPSASLSIEIQGSDITVHLATDGSSIVTTTAAQLLTAWAARSALDDIVATAVALDTGVLAAVAKTYFSNRAGYITVTSVESGTEGSEISVELLDPGGTSALSVTVTGKQISVSLETASGLLMSTAAEVAAAITADTDAAALVTAVAGGTTTALIGAYDETFLPGGRVATLSDSVPLGTGEGQAGEGNYAAANLVAVVHPASKAASLDLYPEDAFAFLVVDPPLGTNNVIRFTAVDPGITGNDITIEYEYLQQPSVTLDVTVTGSAIKITLETDAASDIASIASDIVTAVNADVQANLLVLAAAVGTDTGLLTGNYGPTNLSNTRTIVRYTALAEGIAGESIRVRYVDPAAINQAIDVTVSTNDITVSLATDASGDITSTPATIITAVNADVQANLLVLATLPTVSSPSDGKVAAIGYTPLDGGAGPTLRRTTTISLTLTRDDLVEVERQFLFNSGTADDTSVSIDGGVGSVTITPTATTNSTIIWTFNSYGAATNDFTIAYSDPGVPNSPLSLTSTFPDIVFSLATDQNGDICTTAYDLKDFAENEGSLSALTVQISPNDGAGYGRLAAVAETNFSGGTAIERYFECTEATIISGGEEGDEFVIQSLVERTISL